MIAQLTSVYKSDFLIMQTPNSTCFCYYVIMETNVCNQALQVKSAIFMMTLFYYNYQNPLCLFFVI